MDLANIRIQGQSALRFVTRRGELHLDGFSKPLLNPPLPSENDKVWELQAVNERFRPETVYKTTKEFNLVKNFLLSTPISYK